MGQTYCNPYGSPTGPDLDRFPPLGVYTQCKEMRRVDIFHGELQGSKKLRLQSIVPLTIYPLRRVHNNSGVKAQTSCTIRHVQQGGRVMMDVKQIKYTIYSGKGEMRQGNLTRKQSKHSNDAVESLLDQPPLPQMYDPDHSPNGGNSNGNGLEDQTHEYKW
ncbi:hypothetical protein BKA82DRAFT_4010352 [Pisolithus tinctorius]|nr:hypothetical protein BKA82DRAFT_4010352 [Pisolithus tinctorius]